MSETTQIAAGELIQGVSLAQCDSSVIYVQPNDILMVPVSPSWTPAQMKEWLEHAKTWLAAKGVTVDVMPIAGSHLVQVLRQAPGTEV